MDEVPPARGATDTYKRYLPQNSLGTVDTAMANDTFQQAMCEHTQDFMNITGEPGDVQKSVSACRDTALTFEDVSFSVKDSSGKETVILEPVSGHFDAGSLVAVMGPSGSGKTTLLDILANKKSAPHGGTVHLNGRPRDRLFSRVSSYVAQDDILPAHLTVQEAVTFHFSLKHEQPSKFSNEMLLQHTDKILEDLGLFGVRRSWIGDKSVRGISGGQRRRVSLACGLAAQPQIMFCDEPTSGLSATDAETTIKYMRLVAHKENVTILVVIHQPRRGVAKLFDHLLLLTSGPGRCVYNGLMRDLPAHCERVGHPVPSSMNPTDFIMDRITPGTSKSCEEEFEDYYDNQCKPAIDDQVEEQLRNERPSSLELLEAQRQNMRRFGRLPPVRESKYGVRFRKQLWLVGCRQLTLYFRHSRGILADLLVAVGKGVVVGLTYMNIGDKGAQQMLPFIFMLMMSVSIDGMKGMPKLIEDRRVMKIETSEALYSEWAYIIPFTLISWIQAMLSNTIFIVVLFAISGLPWALFASFWFWSTLLYLSMDSMFLMLSAIAKDANTAYVMALPFFMLFLLFNGFTVNRKTADWYLVWLVNISPVAYAIEQAQMSAGFYYGTYIYTYISNIFGYEYEPGRATASMCLVTCFFRIAQVLSLKFLNNIRR